MCEQLGLTWGVQGESEQPVVLESGPARLTFGFANSVRGPHRIEPVQAIPGTLWEVPRPAAPTTSGTGPTTSPRPCRRLINNTRLPIQLFMTGSSKGWRSWTGVYV